MMSQGLPANTKEDQQLASADRGQVRQNARPPRKQIPSGDVPDGDEE
jgi:hypothetical protein